MQRIEKLYQNYKKVILIPILLLVLSLLILGVQQVRTGSIINRDISLKGGISATISIEEKINTNELRDAIKNKFPASDILVRELADPTTGKNLGVIVEATDLKSEQIKPIIEENLKIELTDQNYSIEEIGASLSASFFKELILAILFSFLFMAIVVFITFRKTLPSIAVVLTALTDIVATLAIISILNIKISTAGVAAFLLLIGYSIDTDILLTTRVLKRSTGTVIERVSGAIKTGLTMTITTIGAITVALLITNSLVLKQMFTILLIGLIIDIVSTWLGNAPAIIWYCKKKNIQ